MGTVFEPASTRAAVPTFAEFTQTVAKPYLRASSAQLHHLLAGGVGLEQGVVDVGRDVRAGADASGAIRATPERTPIAVAQESTLEHSAQAGAHSGSLPEGAAPSPLVGAGDDATQGSSRPARAAWSRRRTRSAISSTTWLRSSVPPMRGAM